MTDSQEKISRKQNFTDKEEGTEETKDERPSKQMILHQTVTVVLFVLCFVPREGHSSWLAK